jgi:hypothetical protein
MGEGGHKSTPALADKMVAEGWSWLMAMRRNAIGPIGDRDQPAGRVAILLPNSDRAATIPISKFICDVI